MQRKEYFIATLMALALFGVVSCKPTEDNKSSTSSSGKKDKGPTIVGYVIVNPAPLYITTDISGRTSAYKISEVRPQVNGIIKSRLFREGSRVNAGQILYQIDASTYRATYESSLASVSQSSANLEAARNKFARYSDLIKINAVSQQEYEDARTAVRVASANLELSKAQVKSTSINLKYANLSAPIGGRISKSNVTEGALVTANQPQALATIVDISSIYVDFTQSYEQLLKLRQELKMGSLQSSGSAQVQLILPDGSIYERSGQLLFSDITVDPTTGSVGMRALFPNPDGVLLPGMYVHAKLSRGFIDNAIIIPQKAVSIDQGGTAKVLILSPDNKATPQEVKLGEMNGTNWQIISGLKPGDKVITEGLQKVRPGAEVKAKEAKNQDNKNPNPEKQ